MTQIKTGYRSHSETFLGHDILYSHDPNEPFTNLLSDLLANEFICQDNLRKRHNYIIRKMLSNAKVLFVK